MTISFYERVLLINVYIQPVIFILSLSTNLLSIRIFSSRLLRCSSCTQYFLGYAVNSIIYIVIVSPTQFLKVYNLDWSMSYIGCKIQLYIVFLPAILARLMLILASFDRFCSSSKSVRIRLYCTISKARRNILFATIIMMIYMSPMFVIYYWNETRRICLVYTDLYSYLYSLSQIIYFYILSPLLILIFGILTVYNIHQIRIQRIHIQNRRTEYQLARMLLVQITIHLILTLPFGIIYCLYVFDSSTHTLTIIGIRYLFVIWNQCDYFISFFLYVFTSEIYRKQLINIFLCLKYQNRQIRPTNS